MTTQDDSVPRYFADFVQENAHQHQELTARISGVEGELRIIKALAVGIFITVGAAAIKYLFGL
ncbi:MAG: hypothetical protein OXT51_00810 [Chloroflexota bacterium]|nr:hypothetical protein [Chloroflexota bacterium]